MISTASPEPSVPAPAPASPIPAASPISASHLLPTILCGLFTAAYFAAGVFANSLAVMSDAARLLSDFSCLAFGLFALCMSSRKSAGGALGYGYHRAEVIGALCGVVLVCGVTGCLVHEAICRVFEPPHVQRSLMLVSAGVGLCFNLQVVLRMSNASHNKVPAAPLKEIMLQPMSGSGAVAAPVQVDLEQTVPRVMCALRIVQSLGVLCAAILVASSHHLKIVDPICTLIFSLTVFVSSLPVVRDCLLVLMEGAPRELDTALITADISKVPSWRFTGE